MLSDQAIQDFKAISLAIAQAASTEAYAEATAAKMRAAQAGSFGSSRTLVATAQAAVQVFDRQAQRLFGALEDLNRAEPVKDAASRREQLRRVLDEELRRLGEAVQGTGNAVARPVQEKMGQPATPLSIVDGALARALSEYLGRIGLLVAAHASQSSGVVPTSVSITNHGNVGSIQTGNGNAATVTQSVVTQVSPGEVKAALDALIQALQHAQGLAPDQRAEVVEVLEQVKAEADKDKPNRITVGSLIGGVRDLLEGLQAAPEAWKTVKDWYAFIAANAAVAAPAIGQALQNLGS